VSRNAERRQGSSPARRKALRPGTGPDREAETAYSVEDRIAQRASEIYMEQGRESGRTLDYWLQAEKELAAEREMR
jgi:hypothetical protein